jgi:hypothetical protein
MSPWNRDVDPKTPATEAPVLTSGQDLYIWRKAVAEWVDLVDTAAREPNDRQFKTIRATLGRQLYRALPASHRSVVDEAQARGLVNYRQENQLRAVDELVELIATDPPMAVVSRLINTFNKVVGCKRKPKEAINTFVSRFWGLAADHLMHAGTSSSSQTAEMLAIILLNNASLQDETLTAAKLELIRLAESREPKVDKNGPVVRADIKVLKDHIINADKQIVSVHNNAIKSLGSSTTTQNLRQVHDCLTKVQSSLSNLSSRIPPDQPNSSQIAGRRLHFRLDDAIQVLRSLEQSSPRIEAPTQEQIQALVDSQVQKALLAVGQTSSPSEPGTKPASSQPSSSTQHPSNAKKRKLKQTQSKPKRGPLTGPDGARVCYDCGQSDHSCGDTSCSQPSWATLQRRKSQDKSEGQKMFFQSGHDK